MDENERRPIKLVPPEEFAPIEDKALKKLKSIWPEIYDDVVMYLGLEKAVQRYDEVSRGQAS